MLSWMSMVPVHRRTTIRGGTCCSTRKLYPDSEPTISCVLSKQATHFNCIVFGLSRSGLESMASHSRRVRLPLHDRCGSESESYSYWSGHYSLLNLCLNLPIFNIPLFLILYFHCVFMHSKHTLIIKTKLNYTPLRNSVDSPPCANGLVTSILLFFKFSNLHFSIMSRIHSSVYGTSKNLANLITSDFGSWKYKKKLNHHEGRHY